MRPSRQLSPRRQGRCGTARCHNTHNCREAESLGSVYESAGCLHEGIGPALAWQGWTHTILHAAAPGMVPPVPVRQQWPSGNAATRAPQLRLGPCSGQARARLASLHSSSQVRCRTSSLARLPNSTDCPRLPRLLPQCPAIANPGGVGVCAEPSPGK